MISRPHQPQSRSKNNIFIVEGTEQLLTWNYDYANVLYVVDYGKELKYTYSYTLDTYVRTIRDSSTFEKARRMSVAGVSRIGRYTSLKHTMTKVESYVEEVKELSIYLLKMIDYGIFHLVETAHPRIAECITTLSSLKIISKEGDKWKVPN